jgi:hypothetical protein
MAFKLGHGLGLALALAAAAPGCDSRPKDTALSPKVASESAAKAPTTSIASVKPTSNAAPTVAPPRPAPENPAERVAKLGARIERENASIVGIDFFGTNIGDGDLEVLSNFPDLETLGLSGTKVTDAGLVHLLALKKLQTLKLGFTDVTDHGLVTLAKLTGLQNLDLLRTKVTSVGIADLQKALPRVDVSSK